MFIQPLRDIIILTMLVGFSTGPGVADVRVNEIMASNGTTIADEDGDFPDWIELVNNGTESEDLSGWGLSDNSSNPYKWLVPQGILLDPGEFLLVWASGKDRAYQYDADWADGLEAEGAARWLMRETEEGAVIADSSGNGLHATASGPLRMIRRGHRSGGVSIPITAKVELEAPLVLAADFTISYWVRPGRTENWRVLNNKATFNHSIGHSLPGVFHLWNPVVNINLSRPIQPFHWNHVTVTRTGTQVRVYMDGELSGSGTWSGRIEVDCLGGLSGGTAWQAFEGDLGETAVWRRAMGADEVRAMHLSQKAGFPHTNYSISSDGEEVVLTRPGGGVAEDSSLATSIPRDVSYGRGAPPDDGEWFFFDEPTPLRANTSQAYSGIMADPEFSHAPGFHSEPFDLSITHPDPDAVVYYSTDGTEPGPETVDAVVYPYKNVYPRNSGDPFGPMLSREYRTAGIHTEPIPILNRAAEPNLLAGCRQRAKTALQPGLSGRFTKGPP